MVRNSLFFLGPDAEDWLDVSDDGSAVPLATAPTALAPSEDVLLLAVELPLTSRKQRLAAVAYAMEDRLIDPLADVHVALGPEIVPGIYLVGAVKHAKMRHWLERLEGAGLSRSRIVPDALALPTPPEGSWSVWAHRGRALVRMENGVGFAVAAHLLPAAWNAAGRPLLRSHGEPLLAALAALPAEQETQVFGVPPDAFDLRQGHYAPVHKATPAMKWAAGILAAGAVAHGLLAVADISALHGIASERQAEARTLFHELAPRTPPSGDAAADLAGLLDFGSGDQTAKFLPLLSRISSALQRFSTAVAFRALAYNAADGTMSLNVETSDLISLQGIEAALSEAGLRPSSGAATASSGGAQARIIVHENAIGGIR